MKKKISSILCGAIIYTSLISPTLASAATQYEINSVKELRNKINIKSEDDILSNQEKNIIIDATAPKVIKDYIDEEMYSMQKTLAEKILF